MVTHWLVERTKNTFETVHFEHVEVHQSGALLFSTDVFTRAEYVLAPGQWLSVTGENDEENQ